MRARCLPASRSSIKLRHPHRTTPMLDRTENLAAVVEDWLAQFERALAQPGAAALKALFHADSYWRDVLALTWDIRTIKGADAIAAELKTHVGAAATAFKVDLDRTPPRRLTRAGTQAIEAIFSFATAQGRGSGVLR